MTTDRRTSHVSESDDSPIRLFRVEDGETHWVAARNPYEAIAVVCDSFEHGSLEAYMSEHQPHAEYVLPHRPLTIRCDELNAPEGYPPGSSVYIHVPPHAWSKFKPGLVCSTCF